MKRKDVINTLENLRQEANNHIAFNIAIEVVKNYREVKVL